VNIILKKLSKPLSVIVMAALIGSLFVGAAGSASAQTITPAHISNTTRPGFGFGDHNHQHLGPPGQSNRPGNGHHFFNFFSYFYYFFHHFNFG